MDGWNRGLQRSRPGAATTLAAVLIVLAHGGLAQAGWLDTETVSDPVGAGGLPRVSFDPQGNVFATYAATSNTERLSIRPPDGSFGAGQLSPSGSNWKQIRMGFDASGDGIFAWRTFSNQLQVAYRTPGPTGTFGSVQTVAALVPSSEYDLAVNTSGDALLLWLESAVPSGRVLKAALRPAGAGSVFGAIQTVQTIVGGSILAPRLFFDPAGTAVAVWVDGSGTLVQAFHPDPSESVTALDADFGPPTTISAIIELGGGNELTASRSPAGYGLLGWITTVATGELYQAAVREPGGLFGAPSTLADPDPAGDEHHVAITDLGTGVSAWREIDDDGCGAGTTAVRGALLDPLTGFSPPITLSGPGERPSTQIDVAAGPGGELLLVYSTRGLVEGDDPCDPGTFTIAARYGDGDQGLAPPQLISGLPDAANPWPAVDAAGNAFVAWESSVATGAYYESFGIPLFEDSFESQGLGTWGDCSGPGCPG